MIPDPEDSGRLPREHAALHDAVAVFHEPERALFRLTGNRIAELVNRLVTNDVAGLADRRACYAFLLTPKGRPLADPRIIRLDDEIWFDVASACAVNVEEHFAKYLPPRYAQVERARDVTRLSVIGPSSEETLREALPELAADMPGELEVATLPGSEPWGALLLRREAAEGPGFDLYVPAGRFDAMRAAILAAAADRGGRTVGADAYDIWRIERGLPVYGVDVTQENLPQETGQETRAIDYEKGCYTGQEIVARIHFRGHVNRRLCGLRFQESSGREETTLFDGDRRVGLVTSRALSPRLGPIGLGYVKREIPLGTRLSLSPGADPSCESVAIPFTST